jgi:methylated-DNA-[protein]-cysteine S-methyltransferase
MTGEVVRTTRARSTRAGRGSREPVNARHWTQDTPFGPVTVVTSTRGVRAIALSGNDVATVIGDTEARRDPTIAKALGRWFTGKDRELRVPLDLDGVDGFKRTVLETLVRDVGWGETVSYGELAEMAGRPRAARAVGSAMRDNPLPYVIPCHRVIAAGGKIGGYGGGPDAVEVKRALLAREGVHL